MPPLSSGLDPGVGERRGSPLASAIVAVPGGDGRHGPCRSLGQRPRQVPQELPRQLPRQFPLPRGGRHFGVGAAGVVVTWSTPCRVPAPPSRRPVVACRRATPAARLAAARELLRGAGPLDLLPRAALRVGPGHRDPPVPAEPVPGVLGRHPFAARDRLSGGRCRPGYALLHRGQRTARGMGAGGARHVRRPRRGRWRRMGGAFRGARSPAPAHRGAA